MTKPTTTIPRSTTLLTIAVISLLKAQGYRYVQIDSFMSDGSPEYIEPRYILLIPVMERTKDPASCGIFEPLNSQLLKQWAQCPDDGVPVLVSVNS